MQHQSLDYNKETQPKLSKNWEIKQTHILQISIRKLESHKRKAEEAVPENCSTKGRVMGAGEEKLEKKQVI